MAGTAWWSCKAIAGDYLLPQVAPEWDWDRETFLAQTCLKAGLPADAWQHGAELQGFTAEVFGEADPVP